MVCTYKTNGGNLNGDISNMNPTEAGLEMTKEKIEKITDDMTGL
jgi:hypothetical protein